MSFDATVDDGELEHSGDLSALKDLVETLEAFQAAALIEP